MGGSETLRWYVVRTQARKEAFGCRNLERQGFCTFVPQLPRTVRHGRRVALVDRPLFPRYIFVALDLQRDRWRSVLGTFGVSSVIMQGDYPQPVPRGVVEELVQASTPGEGLDFRHLLKVGSRVRLLAGPFAGRIGEMLEMSDGDRVRILLEILGADRVVMADVRNLVDTAH